jgi:hypothetical protein
MTVYLPDMLLLWTGGDSGSCNSKMSICDGDLARNEELVWY